MEKGVWPLMSEPEFLDPSAEATLVADEAWLAQQQNGSEPHLKIVRPWHSESWATFRDTSDEEPRWLVSGLLPEGQLAFTAAPPKKGKTWLAIGKALSLATGRKLFGEYEIPEPVQTLYVALEGSRPAIRARIGCICRGLGIDPDLEIPFLRMLYRPRPFDLAELANATWLHEEVFDTGARYVVIDVLRQAARIKEADPADFAKVRDSLEPLLAEGVSVDLLHHFGKLNETQEKRTPGERMSGTGAMYGALDVGFYITRSDNGARRLRLELEARDFATPEAIGVVLEGTGTGEHGGFRYGDTATFRIDASAAEEVDLVAELEALFEDGKWRTVDEARTELGRNKDEIRDVFAHTPERFSQVRGEVVGRHVNARPWGTIAMRALLPDAVTNLLQGVAPTPEPHEPDDLFGGSASPPAQRVAPPTGETPPEPHVEPGSGSGSEPEPDDEEVPF
jgi:hypothetical protein